MTSSAITVIPGYRDNQETEPADSVIPGTFDRLWYYKNLCLMNRFFIQADLDRREMKSFPLQSTVYLNARYIRKFWNLKKTLNRKWWQPVCVKEWLIQTHLHILLFPRLSNLFNKKTGLKKKNYYAQLTKIDNKFQDMYQKIKKMCS